MQSQVTFRSGLTCIMTIKWLYVLLSYFFIAAEAAEATVVIKQEKMDTTPVVLESEKMLQSCFCPHGYSSATLGHYHCRYCGQSCRYTKSLLRHEKIHKKYLSEPAETSKQRYYSCRHCGFVSRYAHCLWQHERSKHAKPLPARKKPVLRSRSKTTAVSTGVTQETTTNRFRVSSKKDVICGQFTTDVYATR